MNIYSRPDPPGNSAFPIAMPGYPIIFASAFTTLVFALLGFSILSLACLLFTFFSCYFFRDPDRSVPNAPKVVVSPADGKVIIADVLEESEFYEGRCLKVSVFMSVFNVHVNRMPHEGKITKTFYHPGKFFSAHLDKASKENEHNAIFIETPSGKKICTVQIAGNRSPDYLQY